jgi:hypothetical protein
MGLSLCGRIALSRPLEERRLRPYAPWDDSPGLFFVDREGIKPVSRCCPSPGGVFLAARRVRARGDFQEDSDGSPAVLPAIPGY